ncbi:unnamed protein product [Parascedosporium putredinis]|uniref:Amino acid transporter transmembrane domain-containing protein n=1 Tax=Parascedosporium putredinis TaxID=1442378 RepID=A0A9P1GVP2_9PEZI|nr:unnamed protein product [Parascedosporium putredinis]CAI7988217.1 unnamed protein product [Parascedosporium putredinis]
MTAFASTSRGLLSQSSSANDMNRTRRIRAKDGGGDATIISSIINLLNTIIGAGTLAMPAVMAKMGVTLGVFMILWSGLTAAFGLYLHRAEEIPYLVDRKFWITAFMLPVILLAFLKRLDSLKYTSVIALVSIGYLVILVVYHFLVDDLSQRGPIRVIEWEGPVSMLSSLPVVVFAYTCHQNMFSILNELSDDSPSGVITVIGSSIGSAASVYTLVAITGYLTFGNDVAGNIVSMYGSSVASTLAKAAIVVLVTFSVPLQIHPCRASIDAVVNWRPNGGRNKPSANAPGSRPLLPSASNDAGRQDHGGSHGISELRFAVITTVIIVLSYITALSVSSLDRMLAYVGSTGSTSISFILPGLFYYKISDPEGIHHQRMTKESDDLDSTDSDHGDDTVMATSVTSLRSMVSTASASLSLRRWRSWRWDLEHLDHGLLRKLALALSGYGVMVMVVCLVMNTWFSVTH